MTAISLNYWSGAEQNAIREQLARIVKSGPFHQSRRRQRFLQFIVTETLAGRGAHLKGYNVGLEVFDRPVTFDPVIDPIVRIEAARLREKLREYYENGGHADPIRIELPKGTYTPHIEFRRRVRPASALDPATQAAADPQRAEPAERHPSVAVLPFLNLSATRESDYLAAGLTDTLITDLAKVSGLVVSSRQSSFAHQHSKQPLPLIAADLRVRYLIEGSVHADKQRLRVSANLIDTVSDRSLWAERYDKDISDIFALQDEVCRSIVRALRVKLTPSETVRIGQQGTRSSEAHNELLRGLERYWFYTQEACAEAQRHFSQAVLIDPEYATAHAWLARAHILQASLNWAPDPEAAIGLSIKHARRAIALDDQLPLAHAILGWALLESNDGENAAVEGRKACALDPNSADARLYLACILASIGHGDEALRNMETAMLLQPHPSSCYFEVLGCCQFAVGDFDRAIAAFQRGIEVNPSFILCRYQLAVTYGACGRIDEARAEAVIVKSDCPDVSVDYFLDPELRAIWQRGKEVAGLSQIPGALSLLGQYELALVPAAEQRLSHGLVKISALAACTLVFPRATGLLVGVLL